jgi:hypothetical protein
VLLASVNRKRLDCLPFHSESTVVLGVSACLAATMNASFFAKQQELEAVARQIQDVNVGM